jgi:hypothetical protein
MVDFVCERCRFILDNNPPAEDVKQIKCKFCDEPKGIFIYVDKNSKTANASGIKRNLFIGWTHVACVYWHAYCSFFDETRLEVKQEAKLVMTKTRCKYCKLD